jgi:kinesin family protein 4/21/27
VFDRVFGEDVDQDGIFEYVADSVSSFIQGYNVSILAYGQSGAGKSYTMGTTGPRDQNDEKVMGMGYPHVKRIQLTEPCLGIIPRAAAVLFEKLEGSNHVSRISGSSIRPPSRISTAAMPSKSSANKNWQLKATYVEVRLLHMLPNRLHVDLSRSTMSSCEICFFQIRPRPTNARR